MSSSVDLMSNCDLVSTMLTLHVWKAAWFSVVAASQSSVVMATYIHCKAHHSCAVSSFWCVFLCVLMLCCQLVQLENMEKVASSCANASLDQCAAPSTAHAPASLGSRACTATAHAPVTSGACNALRWTHLQYWQMTIVIKGSSKR